MTGRATDALMDSIHGLTADVMKRALDDYKAGKFLDEAGNALPPPPALLAQVAKFLKDNGIDIPAREKKSGDALAARLPQLSAVEPEGPTH